jgi:septum formation topological specificity factor MinE
MQVDDLVEVVGDSFELLNTLVKLDIALKMDVSVEGVEWDQLDEIEAVRQELGFETLKEFSTFKCCYNDSVQRRIDSAVHYLGLLEEQIVQVSTAFIPVDEETKKVLLKLCEIVLGDLACFIYFQFDLDKIQAQIANGKKQSELEITVAVGRYLEESGKSLTGFLEVLTEVMNNHRPTFTIFEEFPELEAEFYDIAGAYIKDFDRLSDFITADVVKAVVFNESDVEEIIKSLERSIDSE